MLEGLTPITSETKCKVGQLLDTLDESDEKILQAALDDTDTWSALALKNALMQRGISVGDVVIGKHRRGLCVCKANNA